MSAHTRLVKFGLGGAVGAAIGGATASFFAPQSGNELSGKIQARVAAARLAGAEAQAQTEQALINRFRATVNDPAALTAAEMSARSAVAKAAQDAAVAGASS
jgi:gas vesicle protein